MKKYPLTTRIVSHTFRVGLIALSVISAAMLVTEHTNSLKEKRAIQLAKKVAIHQQAEEQIQELKIKLETERADFINNQKHERKMLEEQIDGLDHQITQEMDYRVNGEFKGKRYQALQERREILGKDLHHLQERQQQDIRRYSEERNQAFQKTETEIRREEEHQKDDIPLLLDDPDAVNEMVGSFLAAWQSFSGKDNVPSASQFIFVISLLLALLIELGIMMAFENVVVAIAPLLRMQLSHGFQQEMLKTSLQGEQAIQDIQHEADLDAIRRKADQTIEKARTYVEKGILKA